LVKRRVLILVPFSSSLSSSSFCSRDSYRPPA
jgi:hypothetical protein